MPLNRTSKTVLSRAKITANLVPILLVVMTLFPESSSGAAVTQGRNKTSRSPEAQTGSESRKSEIAALLQTGKMDQAESAARIAIAAAPRDGDLHNLLGVALDRSGRQLA